MSDKTGPAFGIGATIGAAFDAYRTAYKARLEAKARHADADERKAIAAAFNDRYCYRKEYTKDRGFLGGTHYGMQARSGYAWMCPECNRIVYPLCNSVFSGLQYPACCNRPEGHRLNEGIRTK